LAPYLETLIFLEVTGEVEGSTEAGCKVLEKKSEILGKPFFPWKRKKDRVS
jgi:hypothetical protein